MLQIKGEHIEECFAKYLLEHQAQYDLSDDEVAYLAGGMFGAGADTVCRQSICFFGQCEVHFHSCISKTASAISFTIMAAACFPNAQAKVQEELDAIVGKERCMSVLVAFSSGHAGVSHVG